ncbi:glycosyltransferase [Chlorogloeopsis fritschii PCC 9212]|nr:glycosyltransferase [Chlorogloeopsis fritschii]
MIKISVIIPAYNSQKSIQNTIESVLKQTLKNWELIIVDDGSQDSTLEVISQFTDSRIKVFSFPHAGANISRNRGLKHANGEFISFLDADDMWTPDKLELQLQALQSHPQASVAYSWTNCIDEKSQFLRRGTYITATGNVYAKLLVVNFLESGSNPLIKREALITVGGFDESLSGGQDWDLYLRLAARYEFVAVSSPQILYRISGNSLSTNVVSQEAACLTVIQRAFSHAPESLMYLRKYSMANLYKYLLCKSLEGSPEKSKNLVATKFLWKAIINDPSLLKAPACLKIILRILTTTLLPSQFTKILFSKIPQISNTNTLLGYMQFNP